MSDSAEKIQQLTQIMSKIKNAEHNHQAVIKSLAEIQMDLTAAALTKASEKIGAIFSQASRNEEGLKTIAGDLEIEINKLNTQP